MGRIMQFYKRQRTQDEIENDENEREEIMDNGLGKRMMSFYKAEGSNGE